jgi:hypothetical protein
MVNTSMEDTCTSYKRSGNDSRLPFNDIENLLLHLSITHKTQTVNAPSHSMKFPLLSESAVSRKDSMTTDFVLFELGNFS